MSSGHRIERLKPDEISTGWWNICGRGRLTIGNRTGHHEVKPAFAYAFEYTTGKGGRVATRRILLCEKHAREVAVKQGLPFPEESSIMNENRMLRRAELVGKLIESLEMGSRALGPLLMRDSSFEVVAIATKQLAQSNREALLILLDVLADMRDGGVVGPKMLPALREYLDAKTKASGNGSGR